MTQTTQGARSAGAFDEQAPRYDARVGLPESVSAAVARAVVERANVGADDLVLELGAGTGEIGVCLDRLPIRYVGLDASAAMLDLFRAKASPAAPSLIVADCDRPWPLPDGFAPLGVVLARIGEQVWTRETVFAPSPERSGR